MSPVFSTLLKAAMVKQGFSAVRFAKKVSCSRALVGHVITGERLVPLDSVDRWAEALGLRGTERDQFVIEANLSHCPPLIRKRIADLEERLARRK